MDQRLKTVLEDIHHIDTINNQKRLLKEQFQEAIIVFFNGGKFTANKELIAFLQTAFENEISVITDDNDIPIKITNIIEFLKLVTDTYKSATETYFLQYEDAILKSRKLEDLLSL
jgi:hypothetical protein